MIDCLKLNGEEGMSWWPAAVESQEADLGGSRRRPGIGGDDLRARVLDPRTVVDERGHLGHQRLEIRVRLGPRQHDGDLAEHTVGRPFGEVGQRAADRLLRGSWSARGTPRRGAAARAPRPRPAGTPRAGAGTRRTPRCVVRPPARSATSCAPIACAARSPRSRTGRRAARRPPAPSSPPTGRAGSSPCSPASTQADTSR